MADRRERWEAVTDYAGEVYSLRHQPNAHELLDLIASQPRPEVAADLGCGPGFWLEAFSNADAIFGVDFSATLLSQAKERAPANARLLHQDLRELDLPKPVDLAISFNALMPESHEDALKILGSLFDCLAPKGRLILLVPAFDGLLYTANALQFEAAKAGREQEELNDRLDAYMRWFNNPLGYVMNAGVTVVKYWLAEEAEYAFSLAGGVRIVERFRFDRYKQVNGESHPENAIPAWFHGWVLEKEE